MPRTTRDEADCAVFVELRNSPQGIVVPYPVAHFTDAFKQLGDTVSEIGMPVRHRSEVRGVLKDG